MKGGNFVGHIFVKCPQKKNNVFIAKMTFERR